MDTSRDFVSPTYDFMIGNGVSLPAPTPHDCAQLLIETAKELRLSGVLQDIIGNRPIQSSSNWALSGSLEVLLPERYAQLSRARAREVYSHYSSERRLASNDTLTHVYLAHDRTETFWFWVKMHSHHSDDSGIIECLELDGDTMANVFSRYSWSIGRGILYELVKLVNKEVVERTSRLQKMERQAILLERTLELVDSANQVIREPMSYGLEG